MPKDGYMMTISVTARPYGGLVHGQDASNVVDVEFPNVRSAAGWAAVSLSGDGRLGWFREPVTDLASSVVLQFKVSDWIDPNAWIDG